MKTNPFLTLALIACGTLAMAQAVGRERSGERTVAPGEEVLIFTHANWNRDCSPRTPPSVVVDEAGALGAATTRPASETIDRPGDQCHGVTVPAVGVYYRAGRDAGTDTVVYRRLRGDDPADRYTVRVTIGR